MQKFLLIVGLTLACLSHVKAQPAWLPSHSSIPSDTISPDGRYGIILPDSETDAPNKLVDMKTGGIVATLAGDPGWAGDPSMRWGEMEAKWSADSSTLCWIHPDKWFPQSYVVLKLHGGRLAWQVELMKPADREILSRTEAAAPLNFEFVKLDHVGWGSSYPEGFAIGIGDPPDNFSLPLVCDVALTSDTKDSADEPEKNGVRVWLKMTVGTDGSLSYSDFKVKLGPLSPDAAKKVTAQTVSTPLVDTDMGKALLFPGLGTKDGHFAVGWTVQPARKGEPPLDWTHWDPTDPDKLLRLYDWQCYGAEDEMDLPYKAVDFVLNTHTGKTAELPTEYPNWPWKRDGGEMLARWYSGLDGQRYGLIANGQGNLEAANFWLLSLGEAQNQVKDLAPMMRKAVNDLLRERRPEVVADDFLISYQIKTGEDAVNASGFVEVPFVANARSSDQKEYQLSGTVTIRPSDGTVASVTSDENRLEPFVTNEALKKADETLNTIFQARLKSMSPKDAQAFKQKERDWIAQRDADASQAVNVMPDGSTQQAYEAARENSLLESTKKRIEELQRQTR